MAPGIQRPEIILNHEAGTLRQVIHVLQIGLNTPYTKVIPDYKKMIPPPVTTVFSPYRPAPPYTEVNGHGNVVDTTNCSLSWHNAAYYAQHPDLVEEFLTTWFWTVSGGLIPD